MTPAVAAPLQFIHEIKGLSNDPATVDHNQDLLCSKVNRVLTLRKDPGMNLEELQRNWHEFGKTDPLFAILTVPAKKGNRWNEDEFFNTGEQEIESAMTYLSSLDFRVPSRRALDFGCGVGRVTQALCRYFEHCDGVDIAPSMIGLARRFNKFGHRCAYHVNIADNLQIFGDNEFDFVYSMIVLQHIEPQYSGRYIEEFIRVLKPGGVALFQVPSEPFIDHIERLPDAFCRAKISLPDPPRQLPSGATAVVKVNLQNVSAGTWPGWGGRLIDQPICLGNHWLRIDGSVVRWDDGRAPLLRDLTPGEEAELELTVTAPPNGGEYLLEIDVVQERVCWFGQKGSRAARFPVQVISDCSMPAGYAEFAGSGTAPRAEMHCIPRDVVVNLVTSKGGSIVDIREDSLARPGFRGFRYCITKHE